MSKELSLVPIAMAFVFYNFALTPVAATTAISPPVQHGDEDIECISDLMGTSITGAYAGGYSALQVNGIDAICKDSVICLHFEENCTAGDGACVKDYSGNGRDMALFKDFTYSRNFPQMQSPPQIGGAYDFALSGKANATLGKLPDDHDFGICFSGYFYNNTNNGYPALISMHEAGDTARRVWTLQLHPTDNQYYISWLNSTGQQVTTGYFTCGPNKRFEFCWSGSKHDQRVQWSTQGSTFLFDSNLSVAASRWGYSPPLSLSNAVLTISSGSGYSFILDELIIYNHSLTTDQMEVFFDRTAYSDSLGMRFNDTDLADYVKVGDSVRCGFKACNESACSPELELSPEISVARAAANLSVNFSSVNATTLVSLAGLNYDLPSTLASNPTVQKYTDPLNIRHMRLWSDWLNWSPAKGVTDCAELGNFLGSNLDGGDLYLTFTKAPWMSFDHEWGGTPDRSQYIDAVLLFVQACSVPNGSCMGFLNEPPLIPVSKENYTAWYNYVSQNLSDRIPHIRFSALNLDGARTDWDNYFWSHLQNESRIDAMGTNDYCSYGNLARQKDFINRCKTFAASNKWQEYGCYDKFRAYRPGQEPQCFHLEYNIMSGNTASAPFCAPEQSYGNSSFASYTAMAHGILRSKANRLYFYQQSGHGLGILRQKDSSEYASPTPAYWPMLFLNRLFQPGTIIYGQTSDDPDILVTPFLNTRGVKGIVIANLDNTEKSVSLTAHGWPVEGLRDYTNLLLPNMMNLDGMTVPAEYALFLVDVKPYQVSLNGKNTILSNGGAYYPEDLEPIDMFVSPSAGSVNITVLNFSGVYVKFDIASDPEGITTYITLGNFTPDAEIQVMKNGVLWNVFAANSSGSITFTYDGGLSAFEALHWQAGGDANQDGCIDLTDLALVGQDFGRASGSFGDPRSDIDQSGMVDIFDLVYIGKDFLTGPNC